MGVSLEEAIKIAVENGNTTEAGVPTVTKLREITGRDISAAERDEAMLNVSINQ